MKVMESDSGSDAPCRGYVLVLLARIHVRAMAYAACAHTRRIGDEARRRFEARDGIPTAGVVETVLCCFS